MWKDILQVKQENESLVHYYKLYVSTMLGMSLHGIGSLKFNLLTADETNFASKIKY